jgi:hypothetical protein
MNYIITKHTDTQREYEREKERRTLLHMRFGAAAVVEMSTDDEDGHLRSCARLY